MVTLVPARAKAPQLDEAAEGVFGHRVGRIHRAGDVFVNAGDDDDAARGFAGGGFFTGQEFTGGVGDLVHRAFIAVRGEAEEVAGGALGSDHGTEAIDVEEVLHVLQLKVWEAVHGHFAGVADEDIQPAELFDEGVDRGVGGHRVRSGPSW